MQKHLIKSLLTAIEATKEARDSCEHAVAEIANFNFNPQDSEVVQRFVGIAAASVGEFVPTVKEVRNAFGLGLKDAKDYVEKCREKFGDKRKQRSDNWVNARGSEVGKLEKELVLTKCQLEAAHKRIRELETEQQGFSMH